MAVSVAVVGATGAVGEIMRQVLVEHKFPCRSIKFLASERMPANRSTSRAKSIRSNRSGPKRFAASTSCCPARPRR